MTISATDCFKEESNAVVEMVTSCRETGGRVKVRSRDLNSPPFRV